MSGDRQQWIEDVRKLCIEQDFRTMRMTDGRSIKVFPKTKYERIIVLHPSSDPFAFRNAYAQLRRIGVDIPHRSEKAKEPKEQPMVSNVNSKDIPKVQTSLTNGHDKSVHVIQQPVNQFQAARQKLELAFEAVADAMALLEKLEGEANKLQQLRNLLRDGP